MKVRVHSRANAGRSPATRWGRIAFDAAGDGVVEVATEEEVAMLAALNWAPEVVGAESANGSLDPEAKESAALDGAVATSPPAAEYYEHDPVPLKETPSSHDKAPHKKKR